MKKSRSIHHARVCFGTGNGKKKQSVCVCLNEKHRTSVDVEFGGERHGERIVPGAVVVGFILFERDSAWHPLAVDMRPNVVAHQELMQVPLLPILV